MVAEEVKNHLYAIRDRTARANGALKVLHELGYDVEVRKRCGGPRPPESTAKLKVVPSSDSGDDSPEPAA